MSECVIPPWKYQLGSPGAQGRRDPGLAEHTNCVRVAIGAQRGLHCS